MSRNINSIVSIIVVFIVGFSTPISSKEIGVKKVQVVLFAGQSNMEGAGNYNDLDSAIKERIKIVSVRVMYSNGGETPKPLSYYFSQYQKDRRGFGECFGPELFVGLTLAEQNPDKDYLFIKEAHGGTALYGAWNPEWTQEKAKEVETGEFKQGLKLYSLHLSYIKDNLKRLTEAGKSYEIVGLFWMQGENDAAQEVSARSYEENLTKLINGYRTELSLKELPFVMGQINSSYGKFPQGPEMVRQAMIHVSESLKNVAVIKTSMDKSWSDFPKHTDNVHYNAEGQKRLGTAFALKLTEILKK